jgi:peptidase E
MAKMYLLGGENLVKRDSRDINAEAFLDAGGAPNVLVFPWARASFDKTHKRRTRVFNYFRNLGASTVHFAEYSDTPAEITEKVNDSDLIYLTGGVASVLIERLKGKGVDRLLREYNRVVVGRSAGALVLGNKCIVSDRPKHKTRIISGLGLVDFNVKTHYTSSKENEMKKLSAEMQIYAIPARSAIVYNNGELSFIGDVYLFQNGEITLIPESCH